MKNLYNLLCDARTILDQLNIPYGHIQLGKNLNGISRWGYCAQIDRNTYRIQINNALLQDTVSYEAAMSTVIHELLHAYKGRMCHTGDWKKCANIVNAHYPQYNIKRCSSAKEKGIDTPVEKYKYKITCNKCGKVYYYMKRNCVIKVLEREPIGTCICRKCSGDSFKLEELK